MIYVKTRHLNQRYYGHPVQATVNYSWSCGGVGKMDTQSPQFQNWRETIEEIMASFHALHCEGAITAMADRERFGIEGSLFIFDEASHPRMQELIKALCAAIESAKSLCVGPAMIKTAHTFKVISIYLEHEDKTVPFSELDTEPIEPSSRHRVRYVAGLSSKPEIN